MSLGELRALGLEDAGATIAHAAAGLLRAFNTAGVLALADVHTAGRVGRICREPDERVRLALALTVRALRLGSVCVDLTRVHRSVFDEGGEALDTSELPWPEPQAWLEACRRSPMVSLGAECLGERPLRLVDDRLYLERYWLQEETVRRQMQRRWAAAPPALDADRAATALERLFPPGRAAGEVDQRLAAAVSALSPVTVIAGGPGTGKTTTVAKLLALLTDQPGPPPRIALAAPTGKAAARLTEAVAQASAGLGAEDWARLGALTALTVHRLLGWLPGSRGRFRHHALNHLPYDVVVVDETSMVSLTLMARLLEAVRPGARLILVGDPHQLSSVEAGAVLADITGAPGNPEPGLQARLERLGAAAGAEPPVRRVVELRHTWRFGDTIDRLARAIRKPDPDAVMAILRSGADDLWFGELDAGEPGLAGMDPLEAEIRAAGTRRLAAARAGNIAAALAAIDQHRLLCGHRRGPYGVSRWSDEAERWLARDAGEQIDDRDGTDGPEWYVGRPVLVTANDYELGLYNGDIGVVVTTAAGPRVAFARGRETALFAPVRLEGVQTVHAMTVHRAQGSQFDCASFLVPPPESPLLTRELLYTAVTRASARVQVFGTEDAIRRAVLRPADRASGLRDRL